jgi:hypothetical protein
VSAAAARRSAALALAALVLAGLAVPRAPAAVGAGPGAAPADVIPDGAPYDSTRGDSVGEAALYLAWGAPYGSPGARQNVNVSCGDTTRMDTLYLSIETGRDLPRLVGMYARLSIRPQPGGSLGPFWGLGEGGANRGGLLAQMDADDTFPCARPWLYPGMGGILYTFEPSHGEIVTVYAVVSEDGVPIAGRTRYCFARLLFRHRRCELEGSRQPVCVEWWEGGYTGGGPDIPVRKGPGRFASVNSPGGSVCESWRRLGRIGAWRPPPGRAAPANTTVRVRATADSTRH